MLQVVLYVVVSRGEEENIFLFLLYQAKNPFEIYFMLPRREPSILNYFYERRRRKNQDRNQEQYTN
jgi:hypothetical protein